MTGGRFDAHLTQIFESPKRVLFEPSDRPGHEAIEVESEDGIVTLITFRHIDPENEERLLPPKEDRGILRFVIVEQFVWMFGQLKLVFDQQRLYPACGPCASLQLLDKRAKECGGIGFDDVDAMALAPARDRRGRRLPVTHVLTRRTSRGGAPTAGAPHRRRVEGRGFRRCRQGSLPGARGRPARAAPRLSNSMTGRSARPRPARRFSASQQPRCCGEAESTPEGRTTTCPAVYQAPRC